jgi:hypothetical protein
LDLRAGGLITIRCAYFFLFHCFIVAACTFKPLGAGINPAATLGGGAFISFAFRRESNAYSKSSRLPDFPPSYFSPFRIPTSHFQSYLLTFSPSHLLFFPVAVSQRLGEKRSNLLPKNWIHG